MKQSSINASSNTLNINLNPILLYVLVTIVVEYDSSQIVGSDGEPIESFQSC